MIDWKQQFSEKVRFIDQRGKAAREDAIASFAYDDTLAISVGNEISPPAARLWVHEKTVILGIPDAKLPHIHEAIQWLGEQGYQVVIRNSGGLAVVLDSGILNLTFVLPDAKNIGIHEGYQAMVEFIQYLFEDVTNDIKAFEIKGSYCPGDYDLSIGGKKFAGISQRRVKNGSAVQIYLCIEGSGKQRAELIKQFYRIGRQGEANRFDYPEVHPSTMASLSELLALNLTVDDVARRILQALRQLSSVVVEDPLSEQEREWFGKRLEQMHDRNKRTLVE
ncbi:lipoate--protein ligase family protein [Sediminibacillus albus]|uniref:Octanoyl-[GcvH]:protein N-octanoyltransferase n=1 Tax=Sediminibacillus albus TaxID=407036 RepID=A0A1G8ZMC8_9BACI|nr:lipoate--protein ligase family protein [Sediminibacillus albus]SDK16201.1 octanoyl-[GcvH]:protein N-octanoyltransferase/lipoyl amidotransferase [Sediminibacillus albus]